MHSLTDTDRAVPVTRPRMPHQAPGAERGLSRGADNPLDGVDPSILGGLLSAGGPLIKKIFDLF
jgi:hypothetical protein